MVADCIHRNISAQPSAPAPCPNGIILAQMFAALAVPSPSRWAFPVPRLWHLVLTFSWGPFKPASGVEVWPQSRKGCFQETRVPGDLCLPQAVLWVCANWFGGSPTC